MENFDLLNGKTEIVFSNNQNRQTRFTKAALFN